MLVEVVKEGTYAELQAALESDRIPEGDELATALLAAVRRGELVFVRLLLQHGANPNRIPPDDVPTLHSAVEHEEVAMIRLLVEHGADINVRDETGWTPLHVAVDLEGDIAWQEQKPPSPDLTRLLLQLGADPNIKNDSGKTPLDIAKEYDHVAAVELLEGQSS